MTSIKALVGIVGFIMIMVLPGQAQAPWLSPVDNPDKWGLAIVDVETTGLDPAYHEMIDLGVIYTDLDGTEIGRLFIRMKPDHPERIGEIARGINGYSIERWRRLGAVSQEEAVARFLAFHKAHKGERQFLFTAYNAYFDRSFLDALLKEHGKSFRELYTYFLLDLPSFAFGKGIRALRNGDVARAAGIAPETSDPLKHTGISGAEWNLELYKTLINSYKN